MYKKSLIIVMVPFLCLVLVSAFARATCDYQDLEGTWNAELWGAGASNRQCWDQCTLTIGPDGVIEPGGTLVECLDGTASQVTGGQLTISPDCVIEGYIETSNGTRTVGNGAFLGNSLALGVIED